MEADDIEIDSGFPIEGDNQVDKISYKKERVYINQTQDFDLNQNYGNLRLAVIKFVKNGLKIEKGEF